MLNYRRLTEAERAIWRAVEAGTPVQLPLDGPEEGDPAAGAAWGRDRQVRAQLLDELVVGDNGPKGSRPRALKLAGARITGALNLEAATLACPLSLRNCFFDQAINLREAQASAVRLHGCHAPALDGEQFHSLGNLELKGFTAHWVNLISARIGGELSLDGAHLGNRDSRGVVLRADRITVEGSMSCDSFTTHGIIALTSAKVGGILIFAHARLSNPGNRVLVAHRLTVGQSVFCNNGFTADGEITLTNAHIGGALQLPDARLTNRNGCALQANGISVAWDINCTEGFVAQGKVSLAGAQIGSRVDFREARINDRDRQHGLALDLEAARMRELYLLPLVAPNATINLTNAQVGSFHDDPATWPPTLKLRGFVYERLENDSVSVTDRLRWLTKDLGGYAPQLYEQLAGVYRKASREEDARTVAIAKQRRRRRILKPAGRLWSRLLGLTVGYGYKTWRVGVWLAVLVGLGWWIFDRAYPAHLVAAKPPGQRPSFHAGLYTLDLLVPFADFGYQNAWIPTGWARLCYVTWTLAGWVLITAVVAALTGLIKRD